MKPPGVKSLIPMEEYRLEEEEGYCDHSPTHGRWGIKWEEKFYVFSPGTNLQKDIWLGEAKKKIGAKKAHKALRWWCFVCEKFRVPPKEIIQDAMDEKEQT